MTQLHFNLGSEYDADSPLADLACDACRRETSTLEAQEQGDSSAAASDVCEDDTGAEWDAYPEDFEFEVERDWREEYAAAVCQRLYPPF